MNSANRYSLPGFVESAESGVSRRLSDDGAYIGTPVLPEIKQEEGTELPINQNCMVCGDKATGKHYGAHSCDGCKGFFRRSVRKQHNYACRFDRRCLVNKDKRNQCRYCRLWKCIAVGMKREAVQNERDKIGNRRASTEEHRAFTIASLLHAERIFQQAMEGQFQILSDLPMKIATITDVCESMKSQLVWLVEWAKSLEPFTELTNEDQMTLLRAHAGEHLILGVAKRSRHLVDVLLLGNNCQIPRNPKESICEPAIARIGARIIDELVTRFHKIQLDDPEFACLKAIIFFDPDTKGLVDVEKVAKIRGQIQENLEVHILNRPTYKAGRISDVILTLIPVHSVAHSVIEQLEFAQLFGVEVDSVLKDMLLGGDSKDIEMDDRSGSSFASPDSRNDISPIDSPGPNMMLALSSRAEAFI